MRGQLTCIFAAYVQNLARNMLTLFRRSDLSVTASADPNGQSEPQTCSLSNWRLSAERGATTTGTRGVWVYNMEASPLQPVAVIKS